MKSIFIGVLLMISSYPLSAQLIKGYVYGTTSAGESTIPYANISWDGTQTSTFTDEKGYFEIEYPPQTEVAYLVVSFVGYQSDTVIVYQQDIVNRPIKITLSTGQAIKGATVTAKNKTSYTSLLTPATVYKIGSDELSKAACCNLSEAFETTAAVNVNYTDAVTGVREIQLLGLAGAYSAMTMENLPIHNGLATNFGLNYIPGTWLESIQVLKGTGSVRNGYEAITGQLNLELWKPHDMERLYVNLYGNSFGRAEGNVHLSQRLGERWSTALFLHGDNMQNRVDPNGDGFMDQPLRNQINVMNRWRYANGDKFMAQFGIKALSDNTLGGQMDFDPLTDKGTTNSYGASIKAKRLEGFYKNGWVFNARKNESLAMFFTGSYYDLSTYFGLRDYNAIQSSLYTNVLYQKKFFSLRHLFTFGGAADYRNYVEYYEDTLLSRKEVVPGLYTEYTYNNDNNLSGVIGLRVDYHNLYGLYFTPRFNLRYNPDPLTSLRLSAGRGIRTANVLAENTKVLVSSRKVIWQEDLLPEKATNIGISITRNFVVADREGSITGDYFRTDFQNRVIIDLDHDPSEVNLYNLRGRSYANSFQVNIDYELLPRLDIRLAWKIDDSRTTTDGKLAQNVLMPVHKGLINLAYKTANRKWLFDITAHYIGKTRLPSTHNNPDQYQRPEEVPAYPHLIGQITRKIWRWELYVGGENLLNTTQTDPIVSADDPFGPYFDASLIYKPVYGAIVYGGLRFRIPYNKKDNNENDQIK